VIDDALRAAVLGRAQVHALVPDRLNEAREVALSIADPWFRCQSLTSVAAHELEPSEALALIELALAAAAEGSEPNRVVSVSAWPLSLLVHIDPELTASHVARLVNMISSEPHSIRRADGLLYVMYAVYPDRWSRAHVLAPLVEALAEGHSPKKPRLIRDLALLLASDDLESAERVLSLFPETKETRQARRLIANGERLGPRFRLPGHARVGGGAA
jgi:hypothetical protein